MDYHVTRGKINGAQKVVFYGPEGIGKSTVAAKLPDPLFIDTEGSTKLMDVARMPNPSSWIMLMDEITNIRDNPSKCRTLVIDTADWAERLCVNQICAKNGKGSIEDFGYGKGYTFLEEDFGRMLNLLDEVIERGVHVCITAHANTRKIEQPDEMGAYDHWEMKLEKKTAALLKEWCDVLLFINYKTIVVNVDGQGTAKGKNKAQGGQRVMYSTHTPSWDAKNRHGLPDEMPFDFKAIAHIFAQSAAYVPPVQAPAAPPPAAPVVAPSAPPMEIDTLEGDEALAAMSAETETEAPPISTAIPQALLDLMAHDKVTEQEIMFAVAGKGYYPNATPISNYDPSFVNGVLIAAWPQVYAMVKANREKVPF